MKNLYSKLKYTEPELWLTIDKALDDLEKNQDIKINTKRDYAIGYLCKVLNKKFNKKYEISPSSRHKNEFIGKPERR